MRVLASGLRRVRGPLKTEFERVPLPLKKHSRAEIEAMGRDAPSYRRFFTAGALAKLDRGEKLLETYAAPLRSGSSGAISLSLPTAAKRWSSTLSPPSGCSGR